MSGFSMYSQALFRQQIYPLLSLICSSNIVCIGYTKYNSIQSGCFVREPAIYTFITNNE